MRILDLLDDLYVVQFDVEILIDRLERSSYLNVILELHSDLVVDKGLEETVES